MNRLLLLSLCICLGIISFSCDTTKRNSEPVVSSPTPQEPSRPSAPISYIKTLDDGNFNKLMKNGNGLKVAYFWATWCGPCRTIAPAVENISREYKGRVVLGKIDVDTNGATRIINDVTSIPTFIFFKDGEVVHRSSGLVTEQYLQNIIERLL